MYTREKLCRDQNYKSRKSDRNPPSFSSTLLDEIYRSIDGNVENSEVFNGYKEKSSRRHSRGNGGGYEEMATITRACLVEKWMDDKAAAKKRHQFQQDSDYKQSHDNDLIFFSSTSSSSDSSGALSSSDTEFFASTRGSRQKVSCFTTRPKPVRTGAGSSKQDQHRSRAVIEDDDLIESKSRALKIYANLKKVKQPISPGGRLTSFINSLFSNANGKKSRNPDTSHGFRDNKTPAAGTSVSSSSSRSCLSKYSPRSREKMRNGPQRTVRFEPVSMIADQDLRPCGEKSIYGGDSGRFTNKSRQPLPENVLLGLKFNKKIERAMPDIGVKGYINKIGRVYFNEDEEEEDDEDCFSDSSSDLFELDHISLFGSNRYNEELPVYETTRYTNLL